MTAHTSRDRLNFELPKMLSYHSTWDDADYEPQFPVRRWARFIRLVVVLRARWRAARARQAVSRELAAMSAREFADMGITQHDATRLFDPLHAPEFLSRGRADVARRTDRASPRWGATQRTRGNTGRMPDTAAIPATTP